MRRPLLALAVVTTAAVTAPAPPSGSEAQPANPGPVPVVVIEGRGFGHGVGMAQDGAYWMGRDGASTAQILNHFYPGTKLGRAGGQVAVTVLAAAGGAVVSFPGGGEVRDARDGGQSPGFPLRVPGGGVVHLRFDGRRYTADLVGRGTAAPSDTSLQGAVLAASSRPVESAQLPPLLPPAPPVTLPPPPAPLPLP
ncbi:MAG: hypothetical protein M3N68_09165, partial [Actinomycetota bacterium]|nr:hypothetical protein [Actinomycetota bacterium]